MSELLKFGIETSTYLYKEHKKITLAYLFILGLEIILIKFHQDAYIELILLLSLPIMGFLVFIYGFYNFRFRLSMITYDLYKAKKNMLKVLFIFLGINCTIISIHVTYEIIENILGHGGSHSTAQKVE